MHEPAGASAVPLHEPPRVLPPPPPRSVASERGSSRAHVAALLPPLLLFAGGCSDLLDPDVPAAPSPGDPGTATAALVMALAASADSIWCFPEVDRCQVETVGGKERCHCSDEPFVVVLDPEDPDYWDPGPPPPWPDAPGWPSAGSSPSAGTWGEPCDLGCPLEFQVALECDTGIVRGDPARCDLIVDPAEVLDHVYGWTFQGKGTGYEGLNAYSQNYHEVYWEGPVVAPGEVRVDFVVKDEWGHTFDVAALSEIAVVARQGSDWQWTWGDGIHYAKGGLTFPAGDSSIGKLCHPEEGCGRPLVQPDQPQHLNGYTRAQVTSGGPNHGLWWISAVTVDVRMASALNPDYLSGGTEYPTTQCPPFTLINFWYFNHYEVTGCGGGGSGWGGTWLDWAWDHEWRHAKNVENFVVTEGYTHLDVPTALEELVQNLSSQLDTRAAAVTGHSAQCTLQRAAIHNGNPGHPMPDFDVWFWGPTQGEFWRWQPSDGPGAWGQAWDKPPVEAKCYTPVT